MEGGIYLFVIFADPSQLILTPHLLISRIS